MHSGYHYDYHYKQGDPFRLEKVDVKSFATETEKADTIRMVNLYEFDGNGNQTMEVANPINDSTCLTDTAGSKVRQYLWDEDNRMLAANVNGFVSNYFYDAAGERTVKISAPDLAVFVNGAEALKNDSALVKFVGYVSPYLVVSNGGRYTKHIYAGTQRIASKLGDIEAFGADPRRVEYAGADLKEIDFGEKYGKQTEALFARYDSLGVEHRPNTLNDYVGGQSFCCGEKEFEPSQTGKDGFETPDYEHLIFFYHPDHLGSTSLVTDNNGNVVQSVAYIPYGEIFVEERNGAWNSPYLFNSKELDEETGFYYYGARYLNPTSGMWLSVDPLWEKYAGMSPYNYCAGNPVKFIDPNGEAPWDNQNIRHAKKHAENTGGKYIERENKNGFVDASVQDVYMEGQDVVVELTVYKGTARNDKNIFFNLLQAFDESSVSSIFAEGNSDGANQGTMTSRDWSVGLGVVGLVTALATFGTGPTLVEAVAAVLGALNSVDDITTDCQGETFVTRQFDTKEQKNSARTAKAIVGGACAAVDVNSVYKGIKAADDISTIGVGVSVLDGVVSGVGVKSSIESRED